MTNQQKVLPMGRLQGVTVDLDGASTRTNFEVMELMDENTPYPALLGIDWATNMNGVINLKKRTMIFETKALRVVIPLDLAKGSRYIEQVHNDDDEDCSYRMTAWERGWNKTLEDRRISRGDGESCINDSDEEDERWHNQLNRVNMLHCNMVTKWLYCVKAQDRELPKYDGLTMVDEFLTKFEIVVPEHQRFDTMKWTLRTMLA